MLTTRMPPSLSFPASATRAAAAATEAASARAGARRPRRAGPPLRGLVARAVSKELGGRRIVHRVSLHLAAGEILGLLGPNGAGKTTIFYMLTGLVQPDQGAIFLDGQDVTQSPIYQRARSGLSYLPQDASIFRGLSVADNIMAILELQPLTPDERAQKLEALLDEFGLTRLRHSLGRALSGGERRRAEIARCLAASPTYILLDEPFAGIDPIAIDDIGNVILQLKARKMGVLITDHNVRETLKLCDRAVIIHNGDILVSGRPQAILANKSVRGLYLGEQFRL